ncbi:hypothetical protein I4U23_003870 [Adineta vaga]|nr:hypothetical protein I4U23_003870 [Adineta vaga]
MSNSMYDLLMSIYVATIQMYEIIPPIQSVLGTNARNERIRSDDRQMIMMVLFQILITILISLPHVGTTMYNAFGLTIFNDTPSILEQMIYQCVKTLTMFLFYTNSITGFYIYTLTSPKFRTEMKRCIHLVFNAVLTKLGLVRFDPIRPHQILPNTAPTGAINVITVKSKGDNHIHHVPQTRNTINITSAYTKTNLS